MSVIFLKGERKDQIIQQVNIHTRMSLSELSQVLNVSEDTIRRDINDLAEEGKLIKIRGGAMSKAYHHTSQLQETYAHNSKKIIAEKMLPLIEDGMLVLIGGGTTIRELVKIIPSDLKATFVTLNPLTAVELLDKPNLEIILIGGQISRYSQMSVGGEVYQRLSELHVDLCIMGTNAIDAREGLTDSDWETIQAKKAMIKAADKIAVLAISEKMNSVMRMKIADLSEIDYFITELPPDSPLLIPYSSSGIQIV
ncbi:DeoR/GlpR family DNA-binding transcription regulator [Cytophagaceae bacterium DM2B3-1]|uniref:DeoR/GlpR family DNA-binding transcription regulator n=1 Tax=Xanthocytophaga flava TaxID=3048013 RepID=A0ABT7CFQ2_9BACT|nr:DeoR/GlpR family DNA-binding transcription regulator [Xanthocytophaga flavus]MDJ1473671.1 DeoR/GlpR family DNA-binding transcription regulator [Xanthocytophaga flavus]MDJ1492351.1 DeoR/GlpR family DNA-binding transcription regulator [Xanthocytophaga flavus]